MTTRAKPNEKLEKSLNSLFERTYKGVSGEVIASRTGINPVTISLIRNGKVKLSNSRICVLCEIFPGLENAIVEYVNDPKIKTQILASKEDIINEISRLLKYL